MENKLFDSYKDESPEILDLLNDAWKNPGKPILKLDELINEIPYKRNFISTKYRPSIHIGQRKLFMNELQFLNNHIKFVNTKQRRHYFVIYAGGSPGHHMYELSRYYPNVTFIVIDPSRHQSYISDSLVVLGTGCNYRRLIYYDTENQYMHDLLNIDSLRNLLLADYRIFIVEDYCSSELLLKIKTELPEDAVIYLWSDIRTDNAEAGKFGKDVHEFRDHIRRQHDPEFKKEQSVTDGDILWNLAMQYTWLKALEPDACMFKFRLPFYNNDINNLKKFMQDNPSDFELTSELNHVEMYSKKAILYPKGKIYLQPWQGVSSTESRLVVKKKNIHTLIEYDAVKYEAKFTYYNLMERVVRKHNNGKEYYKFGYCECNDCSIEIDTIKNYINKSENKGYILEEFVIPKYFYDHKIIGNICIRLNCLLGTKIEGANEHGINRFSVD